MRHFKACDIWKTGCPQLPFLFLELYQFTYNHATPKDGNAIRSSHKVYIPRSVLESWRMVSEDFNMPFMSYHSKKEKVEMATERVNKTNRDTSYIYTYIRCSTPAAILDTFCRHFNLHSLTPDMKDTFKSLETIHAPRRCTPGVRPGGNYGLWAYLYVN